MTLGSTFISKLRFQLRSNPNYTSLTVSPLPLHFVHFSGRPTSSRKLTNLHCKIRSTSGQGIRVDMEYICVLHMNMISPCMPWLDCNWRCCTSLHVQLDIYWGCRHVIQWKMSLRGKCTGLCFISLALNTKFSLSKSLHKVTFLEVKLSKTIYA